MKFPSPHFTLRASVRVAQVNPILQPGGHDNKRRRHGRRSAISTLHVKARLCCRRYQRCSGGWPDTPRVTMPPWKFQATGRRRVRISCRKAQAQPPTVSVGKFVIDFFSSSLWVRRDVLRSGRCPVQTQSADHRARCNCAGRRSRRQRPSRPDPPPLKWSDLNYVF